MAVLQVLLVAFTALSTVTASDGVETFDKCAGKDFEGVECCRSDRDHCVKKNSFFSQCRPKDRQIPHGWDGEILRCDCGPGSAQLGEFNYFDGSGCNLFGISADLDLHDCHDACAGMGFIACDRPASAADSDEASCWGYSEDTPGACNTRSGSNWVSWFVCPEDIVPGGGSYGDSDNGYGENWEAAAFADMVTGEAAEDMRAAEIERMRKKKF